MDTFLRHFSLPDDPPFPSNFIYDNNPEHCLSSLVEFLYKSIHTETAHDVKPLAKVASNIEDTSLEQIQGDVQPNPSTLQQVPTSTPMSQKRSRNPKRVKEEETRVEEQQEESSNENPPWEELMREKFSLSIGAFNAFKEEQGFSRVSGVSDSFFDFGTPDLTLERMPRYATCLSSSICKESTSLSVYKNLQSGRANGMNLHMSAIEQAFAKSKHPQNSKVIRNKQGRVVNKRCLTWEDTVVTVDFYHSSPAASVVKKAAPNFSKGPVLAATIELLGSQTLKNLQTRLFCENDFVYIAEIQHPEDAENLNFGYFASIDDENTSQSGAIVINNTAYVGEVFPNYGVILSKWEDKNGQQTEPYKTLSLKSTKLNQIEFKLGHPYLYIHGSNCEHLIVFRDVRYLHASDPQVSQSFPRFTYTGGYTTIPCRVNDAHLAKYVVKDCDRLPEALTPLCRQCCENFCYTSDKRNNDVPVGTFKLYPLIQVSNLLLN